MTPGLSTLESIPLVAALEELLSLMQKVYSMTERKEIKKETVPNDEKIFSIYELHTDIIVKGSRDVKFGHKINLTDCKSKLILDCQILKGNPSDKSLLQASVDNIIEKYEQTPKSVATDGGYASKANQEHVLKKGVVNVVFNKIVGSLKNVVSSKNMATRLKKWRSGIEGTISNLKRRFNLYRCNWKGWEHYQAKVLWGVIAYNIRVMTGLVVKALETQ